MDNLCFTGSNQSEEKTNDVLTFPLIVPNQDEINSIPPIPTPISMMPHKIHTVMINSCCITLYKSSNKDVLFRIEALEEDDKWVLDLTVDSLQGQECKEIVRQFPVLFEKLFITGKLSIIVDPYNNCLYCSLNGDVISATVCLSRVIENESTAMVKKIHRLEAKILNIEETITKTNAQILALTNQLSISQREAKYINFTKLDKEKLSKLLWTRDVEFKKYANEQHNTTRKDCCEKFLTQQGKTDELWWLTIMHSEGWELVDCDLDRRQDKEFVKHCKFARISIPSIYRKYTIGAENYDGDNIILRKRVLGHVYSSTLFYTEYTEWNEASFATGFVSGKKNKKSKNRFADTKEEESIPKSNKDKPKNESEKDSENESETDESTGKKPAIKTQKLGVISTEKPLKIIPKTTKTVEIEDEDFDE